MNTTQMQEIVPVAEGPLSLHSMLLWSILLVQLLRNSLKSYEELLTWLYSGQVKTGSKTSVCALVGPGPFCSHPAPRASSPWAMATNGSRQPLQLAWRVQKTVHVWCCFHREQFGNDCSLLNSGVCNFRCLQLTQGRWREASLISSEPARFAFPYSFMYSD